MYSVIPLHDTVCGTMKLTLTGRGFSAKLALIQGKLTGQALMKMFGSGSAVGEKMIGSTDLSPLKIDLAWGELYDADWQAESMSTLMFGHMPTDMSECMPICMSTNIDYHTHTYIRMSSQMPVELSTYMSVDMSTHRLCDLRARLTC